MGKTVNELVARKGPLPMSSEVLIPQVTLDNEEGYSLTATGDDVAISVRNVGKMYTLYNRPQDRLKQTFLGMK